jgi:hypothetical protein
MTIAGNWQIQVDSPVGKQQFVATFAEDAGLLSGTVVNQKENLTSEIFDGKFAGDQAQWKLKLNHINMTLSFDTTVSGDNLSGKVKAGLFGKFNVTGARV